MTVPSPVERTRLLLVAPVSVNTASARSSRQPTFSISSSTLFCIRCWSSLSAEPKEELLAVQLREGKQELEQLLSLLPRRGGLADG